MIVVLMGAPGAGKGTQAELITSKLGFRKISTGDALRKHVKLKTEIGKKTESIMSTGALVPDEVLFEILKLEIGNSKKEKILLDGFPRNVNQARALQCMNVEHKVVKVLHLDVNQERLLKRICGRRVCSECGKSFHVEFAPPKKEGVCDLCGNRLLQRVDDYPDKVKVRLDVYNSETAPVLDFYKDMSLYKMIDGDSTQERVFESLRSELV